MTFCIQLLTFWLMQFVTYFQLSYKCLTVPWQHSSGYLTLILVHFWCRCPGSIMQKNMLRCDIIAPFHLLLNIDIYNCGHLLWYHFMLVWSVLIFPCAAFEALVFICAINVVKKNTFIYMWMLWYIILLLKNLTEQEFCLWFWCFDLFQRKKINIANFYFSCGSTLYDMDTYDSQISYTLSESLE